MKPPSHSDDTPIVTLMSAAGPMLMRANFATLSEVSKVRVPAHHLPINMPPTTASRVFPTAIAIEVASEPAVVAFAIRAPANTPGQTRWPNSSTIARANPVGGQTGVALGLYDDSWSASVASRTEA